MPFVYLLLTLLVLIAITVLPVMIAAKWARARNSGFFASLAAVVVATLLAQLALGLIGEPLLGVIVAFLVACGAYALILRTSFVAAVGIAVIALVLQVAIVFGLMALGLQIPFLATVPTAI